MNNKLFFALLVSFCIVCGCDCKGKPRHSQDDSTSKIEPESTNRKNTSYQKMILGTWCSPEITLKGFDKGNLTTEEQLELKLMMGMFEKMFKGMCVEYFNDRKDESQKDSYKTSFVLLDNESSESIDESGDYEVLADGKRLVLHPFGEKPINIGVEITRSYLTWRIQFSDLAKLGASAEELEDMPLEVASMVMYMTFRKQGKNSSVKNVDTDDSRTRGTD